VPGSLRKGWPLYQLGDLEEVRNFSITLARAIQESGASTVVLPDADCYRMLLTRNSRLGGDLKEVEKWPPTKGWPTAAGREAVG
jgi:hypothetical protein